MIKNTVSKLLTSSAVLATLASGAGMGLTAFAADQPSTVANDTASVTLTGADAPNFNDNDGTTESFTPSFNFGAHDITGQAMTGLKQEGNKNTLNPDDKYAGKILWATDDTGTGSGYTVTAQLGDFTGTKDKAHTIAGTLNLTGGEVQAKSDVHSDNGPTFSNQSLTSGGSEATIMTAAKDAGMGTYNVDLGDTTLDVANGQYADDYTAPLTYTIAATPTDDGAGA